MNVALPIVALLMSPPQASPIEEISTVRQAADSVVFLYHEGTTPCAAQISARPVLPEGTGFFVGLPAKPVTPVPVGHVLSQRLLVTAQHVIGKKASVVMRVNNSDGMTASCFPLSLPRDGPNQNTFEPSDPDIDLAAIIMPPLPGTDPIMFTPSLVLASPGVEGFQVPEGTDIFAVGYMYSYSGFKRNFPVAKFGKVAMLSNEHWYHSDSPRGGLEQAYVVELQSVPGLSGSPVMLSSPQFGFTGDGTLRYHLLRPYIIGVLKGLLPSPVGGSQGVAAIEPGSSLLVLLRGVADTLLKRGIPLDLSAIPSPK